MCQGIFKSGSRGSDLGVSSPKFYDLSRHQLKVPVINIPFRD